MSTIFKIYPTDTFLFERVRFPRSFVEAFRIGWRIVRVVDTGDGYYRCELIYYRSPFRTLPRYHTIPVSGYKCIITVTRSYFFRVLPYSTINCIMVNGLFVNYSNAVQLNLI